MSAQPPQPLDVLMWITVRLHASGELSVGGTIGDPKKAVEMLKHAIDAITRQIPEKGIVVPSRDVEVVPNAAMRELGDMAVHERGDP